MAKKRERIDIVYDMLVAIQNKPKGIKPTHLMYKANLAYRQLKTYSQDLLDNGFITQSIEKKDRTLIYISEKGIKLLHKIKEMRLFENAFGLE